MPPEQLLKASLLVALSSVRSERQFCERPTDDMLFRWVLDLNIRGGTFDQSTFAKNRTRLLTHEVTGRFFEPGASAVGGALHRGPDPAGGVGLPQERPAEGQGGGPACASPAGGLSSWALASALPAV